jgi:hypothetical protein
MVRTILAPLPEGTRTVSVRIAPLCADAVSSGSIDAATAGNDAARAVDTML